MFVSVVNPGGTLLPAAASRDQEAAQQAERKSLPSRAAIAHLLRVPPCRREPDQNFPFPDNPLALRPVAGIRSSCSIPSRAMRATSAARRCDAIVCTALAARFHLQHKTNSLHSSPKKSFGKPAVHRDDMTRGL